MPEQAARPALILILEDDAEIREDLADLLRLEEFEVITATDGRDGLDQLRRSPVLPDLVLLDLMMPVLDGWGFRAEQLSEPRLAPIPVIVVSGAGDVRQAAAALQAAGQLTKPFKLDALVASIRATLGRAQAGRP